MKIIICIFVLVCFLGREKSLVTDRCDEHAAVSWTKICSQRDAEQAQTPHYFKITPVEAIELSKPYFIENPFELTVFADAQNYYVDLSTLGMNARMAARRGVVIDGRTGEIIRGNPRVIGK
ncbi:MAG: hypothetical protein KAS66_16475 [Candidatus Omnitrophica bacterium]|nr:hypothetical protein [Candidatus Omnitrophota bacterium]